jgi:hypothetical protein
LRKHEEESRLTVADIISHIQVQPWNLVDHGAAFFPENMLWLWLALLFCGEEKLDLVYIIISFLCICIGSYLVPYLFPSLFVFDKSIWISFMRTRFSKHTRYTSYCTGVMFNNGLWELLEWDLKLCLVNAMKYDFRKNYRWISCYYHTCSIG